MSSDNWRVGPLKEIIEFEMGQSPQSVFYNSEKKGLPFLQGNRTFGEMYPFFDTYCTEINKTAYPEDVIMSVRAPVGDLNIAREKICIGRGVCAMRMKNHNNRYLYYLLKNNIPNLLCKESGTVFGSVNRRDISDWPVLYTSDYSEQKAIADVLSALDEKIELNNAINKNLEEQARLLFKRWFVDFEFPNENGLPYKSSGGEIFESELGEIPAGWVVANLGEIVSQIKQSTTPGSHLVNKRYVPIEMMSQKSIVLKNSLDYTFAQSSLYLFEKDDILIGAMRVYFHRVNLAPFEGVTRSTTFVIRSERDDEVGFNLCLLNQEKTIEYANSTSKGSTMPYAVWDNGLSSMRFVNPPTKLKIEFGSITSPNIRLMQSLIEENHILDKLRDELLPKLMSGDIRVPFEGV